MSGPPPGPVLWIAAGGTVAVIAFAGALVLSSGRRGQAAIPLVLFGAAFVLPFFGISLHGAAAWATVLAGGANAYRFERGARWASGLGTVAMTMAATVATVAFG